MSIVQSHSDLPANASTGDRASTGDPTPNHTVSPRSTHPSTPLRETISNRPISIWWLSVPLVMLVASLVSMGLGRSDLGQQSPALGKPAPQLNLIRLSDNPTLDALDRTTPGTVALIHFWGTWCGPCKLEYPELSAMAQRFSDCDQFQFLPVSCEGINGDTFDGLWRKTSDYFLSERIESVAFADPLGITRRSAAERLERTSMYYPTSILIGTDGRIAGVWEGYTPESVKQMETFVGQLLNDAGENDAGDAI